MKSSPTKVLETILFLKRDIHKDWKEDIQRIAAWDEFQLIYKLEIERATANCIVAFIVLAYDNNSEYIELHKDRIENKRKIMLHLAGDGCFSKEILLEAVMGGNESIDRVIEMYINNQRDWRWGNIISNIEFHSKATSMSFMAEDFKDLASAGSSLEIGEERRKKADQMIEDLRKEYANLDTALEKENRVKITDRTTKNDFMSFDLFIINRNRKAAAIRAEEEAIKREKEQLKEDKKTKKIKD